MEEKIPPRRPIPQRPNLQQNSAQGQKPNIPQRPAIQNRGNVPQRPIPQRPPQKPVVAQNGKEKPVQKKELTPVEAKLAEPVKVEQKREKKQKVKKNKPTNKKAIKLIVAALAFAGSVACFVLLFI